MARTRKGQSREEPFLERWLKGVGEIEKQGKESVFKTCLSGLRNKKDNKVKIKRR